MFEVEGDWLCEDCAHHLTVICDHCGDRIYQESAVEDDHHTRSARAVLTSTMSAATTVAASCAAMMPTSMTTIIPIARIAGTITRARFTTTTCSDCWDDHEGAIHDYNYMPDLVFHGKGLRHFGVELEIDEGGTVNSNAQKLLDIANANAENLYIKTDGSLDEGLELVTHPMTLEYHLNEMPWEQVLCKKHSAWVI